LTKFLVAARKRPEIGMISSTFIPSVPEQYINVDEDKVLKQGVAISDVYQTIRHIWVAFSSITSMISAAPGRSISRPRRLTSEYAKPVAVLCAQQPGPERAPFLARELRDRLRPEFTLRYNEYRAAQIFGSAAPGYSSQQATAALEDVFHQTMPHEMGFDYMGMSYQEQKARQGVPAWAIFALSLLFVFLILAALYESWTLPFSVLLSTPVAVSAPSQPCG